MELKDIFCYKEREIYEHAGHLQRRYVNLRERFAQFVGCLVPPEMKRLPVEGVEIVPALDEEQLLVRFGGKELRFCFGMVEDGGGGEVRCFALSLHRQDEPVEIGRFTFDGQGRTTIVPPGTEDPLEIHHTACALGIVLSFVVAAFK